MSDKCHIDELLTYAAYFINNSSISNIKKIINNFYSQEDILNSKKNLWNICEEWLEPFSDRKNTDKRTSGEANTNDIFEGLTKLDSLGKLPTFVAKSLNRIPDRHPEEFNLISVLNRLSKVEQMQEKSTSTNQKLT